LHFACAKNVSLIPSHRCIREKIKLNIFLSLKNKAAFETVQYLLSNEADVNALDHQAWVSFLPSLE